MTAPTPTLKPSAIGRIVMKEDIVISVYEVVGNSWCIACSDGDKIHKRLKNALEKGRSVTLSFRNVTESTPAFLSSAIGELYGEFSEKTIRKLLKVEEMTDDDQIFLRQAIKWDKLYFKDPEKFEKIIEEASDI